MGIGAIKWCVRPSKKELNDKVENLNRDAKVDQTIILNQQIRIKALEAQNRNLSRLINEICY